MRIAVYGLGLIGGSVALALAEAGHEVIGGDANDATREAASEFFEVAEDPELLSRSDVAVLALPMNDDIGKHARIFHPKFFDGILTDVASVKGRPMRIFSETCRYVGGHPMAGKETSGWAAAEPGLFRGRKWVLCIDEATDLDDWTELARLWTSIGAQVVPTTAEQHDAAVARVSHIEHLVAAALTHLAADPLDRTLAAGSFRDGTRVAASPTHLVEGMIRHNAVQLAHAWQQFSDVFLETAVKIGDDLVHYDFRMRDWLDEARQLRQSWPPEPGEAEEIPLTREALLRLGVDGGWVESVHGIEVATVRRPRVKSNP
ncbi:prephenate dehydrogenase [Glycomyces buryatensis]|nr:prephenate dehydrogenase/arogenate dehydrogenase family protein [Glycomyces buryatensis]